MSVLKPFGRSQPSFGLLIGVGLGLLSISTGLLVAVTSGRQFLLLVVIGALLGAFLVPVLFARPHFMVYVVAFVYPLTTGLARGVYVPFFRPTEALVIVFFVLYSYRAISSNRHRLRLDRIDLAYAAWAGLRFLVPLAVVVLAGRLPEGNEWNVMLGPLQYYLIFRLVIGCLNDRRQVIYCVRIMLLCSALVAVVGLLQPVGVPGLNEAISQYLAEGEPQFEIYGRVTSVFGSSWNTLGGYLTFSIAMAIGLYYARSKTTIAFRILAIVVALDLITLVLSGSFSGIAGLLLVVLLMTQLGGEGSRRRTLVIVLVCVVSGLVLMTSYQQLVELRLSNQIRPAAFGPVPESLAGRWELWSESAWPLMQDSWIFGQGPGLPAIGHPTEENEYVFLVLRGGILTLASYFALMWTVLGQVRRLLLVKDDLTRGLALGTLGMFAAVLGMNIGGQYADFSAVAETMWAALGLTLASAQIARDSKSAPEGETAPPLPRRPVRGVRTYNVR